MSRRWLFGLGIGMIAYDMVGHMMVLLARLTGDTGAILWNTYSVFIWPSWGNSVTYDAFWSSWFATAILLLILGQRRT